ncbi:phosphonoacetate hydrolase [Zhouia amylolytica]|uniref:Phosphonoacetate hydrolase n=1 Tax=Zhouia amylolytica TaxID=376730 RepID=A0A1I6VGV5_9FLAO|nr:alkylphosphonate utilization protein [Zhouia amylolytica]SFT12890.1 phosphonoacetate hydrolase [Zhouia amylolytica]
MSVLKSLQDRSQSSCELCGAKEQLSVYTVPPATSEGIDDSLLACATCIEQMNDSDTIDANHWRCLNDSMWSEHQAVKVMAWRMLNRLRGEGWSQDLLDMMYLEEDELKIAKAMGDGEDPDKPKHKDSNGAELKDGDSVVLIKDLNVKGANFTAKRGTAVRRISLVHDNPEHIEGKVDGQHIVILTKYVKKS